MYQQISVPIYTINKNTTYYCNTQNNDKYPLFTIDKNSYIVSATIETRINFAWDIGLHSIQIGKYSSLAEEIVFMIDMNHDYKSVCQGAITGISDKESWSNKSFLIQRKGQIIIENDCWIGRGATIMNGVTIHNGAIVATNSVVTTDVPPYAIVGGNPAKIIKYRFTPEQITSLQQIAWWDWTDKEILDAKDYLFNTNIDIFIEKYINKEKPTYSPLMNKLTSGKRFLYFLDLTAPYPLYKKVINWFASSYNNTNNELLLIGDKSDTNYCTAFENLLNELSKYEDYNISINIYDEMPNCDIPAIISSDYYITNRLEQNIYRMCKSELYKLEIISSLNSPITVK